MKSETRGGGDRRVRQEEEATRGGGAHAHENGERDTGTKHTLPPQSTRDYMRLVDGLV